MNERELAQDLSRLIRGEVSSGDLKRLAQREGFDSFSELCESHLPEELARVRLSTRDMVARIDLFRRGRLELHELWYWADELYNISFNHRIAYEAKREDLIMTALSAMSVLCNQRLFPIVDRTSRYLDYVRSCLVRRRGIRLRNVFLRAFEDLPVANLATKPGEGDPQPDEGGEPFPSPVEYEPEGEQADRWVDVVLLDRPYDPAEGFAQRVNWVIAFTVVARDLFDEEVAGIDDELPRRELAAAEGRPAEPQPHAARRRPRSDDRVPALKRLVPNFAFDRYDPAYVCDGDGIAEIILDAPVIGPAEVRYATRLFAMANRVREVQLNGEPLKTLLVRPGAGRRPRPRRDGRRA